MLKEKNSFLLLKVYFLDYNEIYNI